MGLLASSHDGVGDAVASHVLEVGAVTTLDGRRAVHPQVGAVEGEVVLDGAEDDHRVVLRGVGRAHEHVLVAVVGALGDAHGTATFVGAGATADPDAHVGEVGRGGDGTGNQVGAARVRVGPHGARQQVVDPVAVDVAGIEAVAGVVAGLQAGELCRGVRHALTGLEAQIARLAAGRVELPVTVVVDAIALLLGARVDVGGLVVAVTTILDHVVVRVAGLDLLDTPTIAVFVDVPDLVAVVACALTAAGIAAHADATVRATTVIVVFEDDQLLRPTPHPQGEGGDH